MISGFYSKVMSVSTKKIDKKLARKSKLKPKKKAKKQRIRRIKKTRIKPRLVFRVVLEADAGGQSSRQQNAFFQAHLSDLSESELKRLKKKVEQIRRGYLKGSIEERDVAAADSFLTAVINQRLEKSHQSTLELKRRLIKKLKQFTSLKKVTIRGKLSRIHYRKENYSLRRFAHFYFSEIIEKYNYMQKEGNIIPERRHETGMGFVTRQIRYYLED